MKSLKSDLRLLKFIGWNTARGWDCVPEIGASGDQSPLSPIQQICVPGSSWLLLRLGLPTVQPLLLSLKGHSLEIYLQTVTIFTGLLRLIEDVLGKKKRLLQPFSPFIRFGVQQIHPWCIHPSHVSLVVNLVNLTVLVGREGLTMQQTVHMYCACVSLSQWGSLIEHIQWQPKLET